MYLIKIFKVIKFNTFIAQFAIAPTMQNCFNIFVKRFKFQPNSMQVFKNTLRIKIFCFKELSIVARDLRPKKEHGGKDAVFPLYNSNLYKN